jgi:high-affinity Fe2+/Pb2+ permease
MKAYLVVTGTIFGLVAIAHLLRLFFEGHPVSDLSFLWTNVALFLVCGGLAVWALKLLRRQRGPSA